MVLQSAFDARKNMPTKCDQRIRQVFFATRLKYQLYIALWATPQSYACGTAILQFVNTRKTAKKLSDKRGHGIGFGVAFWVSPP